MNPKYPIYIVSKGRWESRLTAKALDLIGVPYRIVIEPQEFTAYSSVIHPQKILVLPFSNLGKGSIPARNWIWEHSIAEGHRRHWILDDNILCFYRYYKNTRLYVRTGATFAALEDFVERYENIGLAGMQYRCFAIPGTPQIHPFRLNTRIYSCILIMNSVPFRWRGRYNEDTDLSLRVLKAGLCTVLSLVFVCSKIATMTMKGGNTDELYKATDAFDGRYEMALSLQRQHPDVTKITRRYGRWQHLVNYRPFKNNRLKLKPGIQIPQGTNEYGMVLVNENNTQWEQPVDSPRPTKKPPLRNKRKPKQ